jgi:hypothetical protein
MSFLSILKKIGTTAESITKAAVPFEPLIAAAVPNGTLVDAVLNGVVVAETLIPQAAAGAQKKAVATALVQSAAPAAPAAEVSAIIDATVAALNAFAQTASTPAAQTPLASLKG